MDGCAYLDVLAQLSERGGLRLDVVLQLQLLPLAGVDLLVELLDLGLVALAHVHQHGLLRQRLGRLLVALLDLHPGPSTQHTSSRKPWHARSDRAACPPTSAMTCLALTKALSPEPTAFRSLSASSSMAACSTITW